MFLKFLCAANLTEKTLIEGEPWNFLVPSDTNPMKKLQKTERRLVMLKPTTAWNVYTSVKGVNPSARISKENPPQQANGYVADYDMVSSPDDVMKYVNQGTEIKRPNFIEISLSGKIRLIWVFEKPILIPNTAFYHAFIEKLVEQLNIPTLLPGYDKNSEKPTEMWTNGGTWYDIESKKTPLSNDYLHGIVTAVSKQTSLFANSDVPLEKVAEQVTKLFPGRWAGNFELDAIGVRFWDDKADNPSGCQIKPDGMLCFTGNVPFVKWADLLGKEWCDTQKIMQLGKAADGIYFNGTGYYILTDGVWSSMARVDAMVELGLRVSSKKGKNDSVSEVERVLNFIQRNQRVVGAAPLINHPPGLVTLEGRKFINTTDIIRLLPVAGPNAGTVTPWLDFPFIWEFSQGFLAHPELGALEYLLAWMQRSVSNVVNYTSFAGQAIFICGPVNNGKNLFSTGILKPLMGNRTANPLRHMTTSDFNSELFGAALLTVNDETAPSGEAEKRRMHMKLKSFVVNTSHTYHAKFEKPFEITWCGRSCNTLNDDPASVGILAEVDDTTRDKLMFFASQPYKGVFPSIDKIKVILDRELPFFCHWLLNIYKPDPKVLSNDRMGVKSYFDPDVLDMAQKQTFASHLADMILLWQKDDKDWAGEPEEGKELTWTGSSLELLTVFQTNPVLSATAREWTQHKIQKNLISLAKQDTGLVTIDPKNSSIFTIYK